MPGPLESEFGERVCVAFGLGPAGLGRDGFGPAGLGPAGPRLTPLAASSTRLWALEAARGLNDAGGRFVLKEFPYHDGERPAEVAAAAEFEYSLWRTGDILMPEPMRARDGQLVTWLTGSRGARVPARVHRWLYTHCDHKPANSMLVGTRVAVLDWDECGYCHPRLEVVESALRWAGATVGEPRSDVARAFLLEYEEVAEIRFGPVTVGDFAKWVAAGAGWFWFTGRRALGWFEDDTAAERMSAAEMATWSIETLSRMLASLDRWAQALSDA